MDPKILKQSLKEAKESIKNKKYSDALKLCKSILREERTNYMALVLLGAALQETEQRSQAPNAYRKATEANPGQALAWQGLVSYYDKEDSDEGRTELLGAYQKLVPLESDPTRLIEVTNKLAQLAQRMGQVDACIEALKCQQSALQNDSERLTDNWSRIASVLANAPNLSQSQSISMEEALSHIINNSTSVDNMENFKRYLRVLLKHGKLNLLAEWFLKANTLFPRAEFPLELILRAYSETTFGLSHPQLDALVPQAITNLLAINEMSGIALLAQGTYLFKSGKIVEARDSLVQASSIFPQSTLVWELLARCHLRLYNPDDAETCATVGMKVIKNTAHTIVQALQNSLDQSLLIAHSKSKKTEVLEQVILESKELLQQNCKDIIALECLANAGIQLKNKEQVDIAIKALRDIPSQINSVAAIECIVLVKEGKIEEATQILSSKLNIETANDTTVAIAWYELGEAQWNIGQYNVALPLFLKAAKLDPLFCLPFSRLADYYRLQANDLEKARRCYLKAFRLNPCCESAGTGLSDIFRAQNNMEANLELLTTAASRPGVGGRWAWLRLGLLHLQMGNTVEAINQFLAALRTDPDNSLCWESLGDAYMVRGAYTAALKSFQKVLELNPKTLYGAIQVASIKLLLGQLSEAEQDFLAVLQGSPDYVPALKGLGETYLSEARDYFARQLFGCARDKSEKALTILTKAAKIQGSLSCIWKMMGDACLIPSGLAADIHMEVCPSLLGQKTSSETFVTINLMQVLQLATRCYCRALSLGQDNSLAWHDLAVSYKSLANHCLAEECPGFLEKALSAARNATELAPSNTNHWNLLGVLASHAGVKDHVLAQHAFIKAVQVQSGNVQAWTNLGTLYFTLGDADLAHKAFAAAQRTEPSYVQCWVGQALIAEDMGHSDAMDLFRHSTQLATHNEAGLGYAHWVCKTFQEQQESHTLKQAVAAASDELVWYTGHIGNNTCAFNLLGLLMERQGLLRSACSILEKALEVAIEEKRSHADMVRTNLARVLSALGKHSEAIEHLNALVEPSFHSQCILAHAYFKAEQFQESYTAYESAWHWLAEDDAQKSHILVAMAAMAYKFQGPDGAKTLLFKCAQLKSPSIQGLFASCALGMLHSDLQLSKLVLKELQPHKDNPKHMADIALFEAYTHVLQRQWSESIRGLSKMVHRHPEHAPLWLSLALLLLNIHPHAPVKASAPCAGSALVLGRGSMDISKVQALVSLSHLQAGHAKASLIEAQRAAHLYPDRSENWAVLVAAVFPRCLSRQNRNEILWLRGIVGLVRRHQECSSRALTQWLSNHERKAALLCDQM